MSVARASSTPWTGSNASAVASFTWNAPTGVADGEQLVLIANLQVASGSITGTPTGGSWSTAVDTGLQGANDRIYVFTRTWHTGDATSGTVTFGVSTPYGAICAGYTGVDGTTPFGTPVTKAATTSGTAITADTMTTTRAGSMGLAIAGITSNSTTFSATPAGYSEWAVVGGKRVDICDKAYPTSGTATGSLSWTASGAVQWWTINVELLPPAAGGTTFTITPSGAITPAGTLAKQDQKPLTGALTPTGALALAKVILKALAGAITPAGTLAKQDQKPLTGALTPTGAVAKQDQKRIGGTTAPSGALAKLAAKPLAGALTPSGALALSKVLIKLLAGALTPTGALTRQPAKRLGGATTPSGALARRTSKGIAAAITPTGALAKTISRRLAGAITASGHLVTQAGAAVWTLLKLRSWDHRAVATRLREHRAVRTELRDHPADDIDTSEH